MITTNGIHIAVARLACSFLFLKNATPQVSVFHWRQATLSAASNEASGALSANTNLSRRRVTTNSHPPNRCPPWPVAETGGWPSSFHPGGLSLGQVIGQ